METEQVVTESTAVLLDSNGNVVEVVIPQGTLESTRKEIYDNALGELKYCEIAILVKTNEAVTSITPVPIQYRINTLETLKQ